MNEPNKLIEQYERENPGTKAKLDLGYGHYRWYDQFVLWLASRPTCGVEQRKFLDEVERLVYSSDDRFFILQKLFKADLQKVIQGE